MWALSIQPPAESGLSPFDVVVTAQPSVTVRDFAAALAAHAGLDRSAGRFLVPVTAGGLWPARQPLVACGLRGGDLLAVIPADDGWASRPGEPLRRRAMLTVVTGPEAGLSVVLSGDVATVGRADSCTVRLDDPLVSRRHVRVALDGPQPVVVDEGSAAGTYVDGMEVAVPTVVRWGARILVGQSEFVLAPVADAADEHRSDGVLRPPRFGEPLTDGVTEVPAGPSRQAPPHLPWAMMLLPLLMGAGLFATGWSVGGLAVMVGWPAIMLLDHWLQKRHAAKQFAAELAAWRGDVASVLERLDRHGAAQRRRVELLHPPVAELRQMIYERDSRLWQRRPGGDDFLACRVGVGPVRALAAATVGDGGDRAATASARDQARRRELLPDAPIVHRVGAAPVSAVVGGAQRVDSVIRAMVVRLCADHSPVEVTVAAILSDHRAREETWLRWLPHAARRAGGRAPVAVGANAGQLLLEQLAAESDLGIVTVCLVDEAAGLSRRRVEAVAGSARRGLHVLWMGSSPEAVPPSTDSVVDLTASVPVDAAILAATERGQTFTDMAGVLAGREFRDVAVISQVDTLDFVRAWQLARSLHGCTDEVTVAPSGSDLPRQVRLADLSEDLTDADAVDTVTQRWAAARGLRAQLGLGVDGVVTVDLRQDGPHALLAGTTGAGKSELLQTLLCSLAVNNPPRRLTFLLVDYKGGAAFRECARLPHTVGYITDLHPAEVRRALTSLAAEITTREELLARHGVKDLTQLEAECPEAAPPSLLICVDEFAALTAEVPEFVDGMVNIAQRGRSLGLHMFLATQRPAGVVTGNIQANTDLRIALRVASPEDSNDVIDRPDAADITRDTPGRAMLRRVGYGRTDHVQVAWMGAREHLTEAAQPVVVSPFTVARPAAAIDGGRWHPHTDLDRWVTTVTTAFTATAAPLPRKPWLPPLPARLTLADLDVDGTGGAVAVGLIDQPRRQQQRTLYLDYLSAGHVLVYGASRAGKTELLHTLAASSTAGTPGNPPHIYGIDLAGGGLANLATWPMVGAITDDSDVPRVLRLLRWLHRALRARNRLLGEHGATDHEHLRDEVRPPRIHLLIDNLPALLDALDAQRAQLEHAALLSTVLQEGRRAGVHVTATTPSRAALPVSIQSAFGQRLVLRMNTNDDYDLLGVPAGVLTPDAPPGRGLQGQDEIQLATTGGTLPDPDIQYGGPGTTSPPTAIPSMPPSLPYTDLPAPVADRVPLAVDADQISPISIPLRGCVLTIAGRAGSGRSAALAGIAAQARRSNQPPQQILHLIPGRKPHQLHTLAKPDNGDWSLILIDDAHRWETEHPDAIPLLASIARSAPSLGLAVVVATDTDHARTTPGELVSAALQYRNGFLLQPGPLDDGILATPIPFTSYEDTSRRSRGLWCADGSAQAVQLVTAEAPSAVTESPF